MQNPEHIPEIMPAVELRASYRPSESLRRAIGDLVLSKHASRVQNDLALWSTIRRVMSEGEYNVQSIKDDSVRRATDEFSKLPERHILFDGKVGLDNIPKQHGLMRLMLNARLNRTTLAARDILGTIPSLEQEPAAYDSADRPRPHAMFIDLPESFFPVSEHERTEKLRKLHSGLVHPSGSHYAVPQALRALRTRFLVRPPDIADTTDI